MSVLGISSFIEFLSYAIIGIGYIKSGNLFPEPLDSEEEKYYIDKMTHGDEIARNILIERNLRLVAHVCKKYSNTNVELGFETSRSIAKRPLIVSKIVSKNPFNESSRRIIL